MPQSHISVHELCKTYRIPQRQAGLKATLGSIFRRQYQDVPAVTKLDFTIQPGEMVGFIGQNGAGKTTTLKMLSGLLYPSGGEVQVAGSVPHERRPEFLRRISMIMGNRHQLTWENTVMDSLHILAEIYRVPSQTFRTTLDEFIELLELEPLLPKMARNLSLGERMKCEFAAALLHQPQILFLDEPTLGVDVGMQLRLRRFIAEYNRTHGATIILTSHYMADVVSLCPRVMLIEKGQLLFDGNLDTLAETIAPFKLVRLALGENDNAGRLHEVLTRFDSAVSVIDQQERRYTLRVKKSEAATLTADVLRNLTVLDLTVEDPPIEAVIDQVYREGIAI